MKMLNVKIKGTRPLLMNKFGVDAATDAPTASRGKKKDYGTPLEQAIKATYHDAGEVFIPSTWLTSAIRNAASLFKAQGKRSSLKNLAGCAIVCPEEKLFLGKTVEDIEVDSRGVVIQRARIVRHRPKFEAWELNFTLLVDDELIDMSSVKAIVNEAGRTQGIGDFRVNKGGPFGSFEVVEINEQNS